MPLCRCCSLHTWNDKYWLLSRILLQPFDFTLNSTTSVMRTRNNFERAAATSYVPSSRTPSLEQRVRPRRVVVSMFFSLARNLEVVKSLIKGVEYLPGGGGGGLVFILWIKGRPTRHGLYRLVVLHIYSQ